MDMAREAPASVEIEGLDIDLGQCPPQARLPSNVRFRQYNLLEDPPNDMVGRYDIINIRHVILVIKDDDPTLAVKNLIKMLSEFSSNRVSNGLLTPCTRTWRILAMGGV